MTPYKTADYKHFKVDGHEFIFLPENCSVYELTANINTVLEESLLFENLIKEELLSGSKAAALNEDIPFQTLVLHTTDQCNLDCKYCYNRKSKKSLNYEKIMTRTVALRAIDFLISNSGNRQALTLVFFGGEPLLNYDLIAYAVEYATAQAVKNNKKINFTITTNGTLLTKQIINFLRENNISVTVSIDGCSEIQDQNRRFLNGSPTYDVILPKIKNLLKDMDKMPVAARVTVTKGSMEDIKGTLFHLLNMGFSEAGFAPVTTGDVCFQLDEQDMAKLLSCFKDLSDDFLDLAAREDLLGFTNLIDLLVLIHEGDIKKYPCGAGLGLFCVDAEGRLYICQWFVGDPDSHMGDIYKGIDIKKAAVLRKEVEKNRRKLCQKCWARNLCAGGCYHEALVREGKLSLPNRHYCRWIKDWMEVGLNVYGRLAIDRPEYLDRLSRMRGR